MDMVMSEIKRCSRHGHPPGYHNQYFNGECVWCLIEDKNQLQAERDLLKEENGKMDSMYQDRLLDMEAKVNKAVSECYRLKEAIKEFSDKWKYYDSKTITGLDDLRAALREVDGGE